MTMKKTLLASVATLTVLAAGSAFAADIHGGREEWSMKDGPALMPVARWQGFYAGGHLGYAWGETDFNLYDTHYMYQQDIDKFGSDGMIGGVQFGYNLQRDRLVLGVEVDLGGLSLDGNKQYDYPGWAGPEEIYYNHFVRYSLAGGFYGDFTGRLGYAADRTLFYVKGGAAFLRTDLEENHYDETIYSGDQTLWGWTAGVGIEYMVQPNWSIKAEYQHFDFGEALLRTPNYDARFDVKADTVTFGVNYHVQGAEQPLK
jgi:outer membrane immunogenic protein